MDYEININPSNKQQIKTLIIDDYQEAIDNLKDLLISFEDIEIVGEARTVRDGICQIITHHPQLLFLDIEMPGKNGLELVDELLKNQIKCPKIIFTTAFGHYAIEAIRANALDYLLKPIDNYELTMAIERFRRMRDSNEDKKLSILNRQIGKNKRIILPTITGLKQISLTNVLYFQKSNNCIDQVVVHYTSKHNEKIPASLTLKQIMDILPEDDFFQIDRKTIINLEYLTSIETKTRLCILNKCDEQIELPISRGRLKIYKEMHLA